MDRLSDFRLRQLADGLRGRRFSATEIYDLAAQRHARRGERDHAFVHWTGDAGRASAQAVDAVLAAGGDAGPLMGAPVSIKDIFAVRGLPTHAGSARRLPVHWEEPGPVVRGLLRQLPVLVGKTHTVEFAFGGLGTNSCG